MALSWSGPTKFYCKEALGWYCLFLIPTYPKTDPKLAWNGDDKLFNPCLHVLPTGAAFQNIHISLYRHTNDTVRGPILGTSNSKDNFGC